MRFKIEGNKLLSGTIRVSGAKNAALKMIAASILFNGAVELNNVPDIVDVKRMVDILKEIGGRARREGNKLIIDTKHINTTELPKKLVGCLRGSITYLGPLLGRFGRATLPFPGGCNIGKRPINYHIDIFKKLGVEVQNKNNIYYFRILNKPPRRIRLMGQSVTATENAILYLAHKNGCVATISNCAAEPEVDDLISFLNCAGAKITRKSNKEITIRGVKNLGKCKYSVMGDRIEAGTWMVAGLMLGKNLHITGFDSRHLKTPIEISKKMGGQIKIAKNGLTVNRSCLKSTNITTGVYPAFPTDLQSPFGLLLTQSSGRASLHETVFEDRLKYLEELIKMGANAKLINRQKAIIIGPTPLNGRHIKSVDLRAGATMVLAGLVARGATIVNNAGVIDRGYEQIDKKLRNVKANIHRVK